MQKRIIKRKKGKWRKRREKEEMGNENNRQDKRKGQNERRKKWSHDMEYKDCEKAIKK